MVQIIPQQIWEISQWIRADGRIEKPTKTIRFIRKENVPADRRKDVMYGSFSCDYKPNKK